MPNPTIEHRCRLNPNGIEPCTEVTSRLAAIRLARELGLPTTGLDRQIDMHLKGVQLHDEAER